MAAMAIQVGRGPEAAAQATRQIDPIRFRRQTLVLADCLDRLRDARRDSVSAVLTDPGTRQAD